MSRRDKEKYSNRSKFNEEINKNVFISTFVKGRDQYFNKIKLKSDTICGWKIKVNINDGDDENEDVDN